jgi:hypothetical protein
MQGYLFSRPVSADRFAQLLAQRVQYDWRAGASQRVTPVAAAGNGSAS